ncbi:hypothetical protein D3C79_864230 [compost metagenome]
MNFNLEPLTLIRGAKVASDQIELRVSRRKLMCGAVVAKMQPVSTGVIVHLDVMDTMRNLWTAPGKVDIPGLCLDCPRKGRHPRPML